MGGVQPSLIGKYGYDVAIMYNAAEEGIVGYLLLGDVGIGIARDALLHIPDASLPRGVGREHLIRSGMGSHPVYSYLLSLREYGWRIHIAHDALTLVGLHPYREIMLTLDIRHLTTDVSHLSQLRTE